MIESLFVCLFVGLWPLWSGLKPFVYWPHTQTHSERSALSCWGSTARVLRNHNLTNTQSSQGALWVKAAVTVKEGHLPFSRSDVTGSDIVAVGWREGSEIPRPAAVPADSRGRWAAQQHRDATVCLTDVFKAWISNTHRVYMCLSVAAIRTQLYETLWHFEKGVKWPSTLTQVHIWGTWALSTNVLQRETFYSDNLSTCQSL